MEQIDMKPSPAGLAWRNHFRRQLLEDLDPVERDRWADGEREVLGPSLAEFQLGESSDGRHLLGYARRFGDTEGDAWLGEAMALFIQEENRHSQWLGEFLKGQGYPLLGRSWVDTVFRAVRKPMGFGLMAGVLVCAEIVAVPYYGAVRTMTASTWLRTICTRLLRDEETHLRFQAANLGAVWRGWRNVEPLRMAHKAFQAVVCAVVWRQHGEVLRRGGYSFTGFMGECLSLLDGVHAGALSERGRGWARLTEAVGNGSMNR
jgi:hypothetical protein